MQIAILNHDEVDIEKERYQLIKQGYSIEGVIVLLEEKYRTISRKNGFTCSSCRQSVQLALPKEKSFYFRHSDGSEDCVIKENSSKYYSQVKKYEQCPKHSIGKIILKTILEGQLVAKGIKVIQGYQYDLKLSIVPDFILLFPSGEKWAIDYITGIKGRYGDHIRASKEYYLKKDMKPLFLIDSYWMAMDPQKPYITLVPSELEMSQKRDFDYQWQDYLNNLESHQLIILFKPDPDNYTPFDVQSLTYIDINQRKANIIRYAADKSNLHYCTLSRTVLELPLEEALTLNNTKTNFINHSPFHEENIMKKLKDELEEAYLDYMKKYKQKNIDKQKSEMKSQSLIIPSVKREKRTYEPTRSYRTSFRSQEEMNKDLYFMKSSYRAKGDISKSDTGSSSVIPSNMIENERESKKREKKMQEIMNHKINGEGYILSSPEVWKRLVVEKASEYINQKISCSGIVDYLKSKGVQFSQSDKLVEYPVKELLQYIDKKMRN